jgi:hypothetical protein
MLLFPVERKRNLVTSHRHIDLMWMLFNDTCPCRAECQSHQLNCFFVCFNEGCHKIPELLVGCALLVVGWVHTCNVAAYRSTVSWQCGRDSWPRNVSKVGFALTLRAFSVCCRYLAFASKGWYGYGQSRCGRATSRIVTPHRDSLIPRLQKLTFVPWANLICSTLSYILFKKYVFWHYFDIYTQVFQVISFRQVFPYNCYGDCINIYPFVF